MESLNQYKVKSKFVGDPPQLVVAPVEGVLEHQALLLDLAFAHVQHLPAEGVDYMIARMRAHLNHSEFLAALTSILLLDQPPAVLLRIPQDREGEARGFQLEVNLAVVDLDDIEKLAGRFAVLAKDKAALVD